MLSFKGKRADYYGGVHPRKQYAPVLEHMRHVMRENDLVAVTDLQASVIVRGYFETWKGKKLPSPLTFLLYPNYVTHFTKSGMGLHALINKQFLKQQRNRNIKTLERSKRKAVPKDYQRRLKRVHGSVYPAKGSPSVDNLDLFWFYGTKEEPHGVLEKALLEERDFERIWVITLLWGDDVPMMLNSHLVNEYFEKNFKRVSGKRKDGVSVVLYTTKGEQGEDKT